MHGGCSTSGLVPVEPARYQNCMLTYQVLPLDAFAGHDMVIWGHREDVEAGVITGR